MLSLSESLATELKDTGVTMTALCPGPTDTDFFDKADMIDTPAFQRSNLMAPQDVAQADRESQTVLTASFDLDAVARQRASWGVFRDRRPEFYGPLLTLDGETRR